MQEPKKLSSTVVFIILLKIVSVLLIILSCFKLPLERLLKVA